MINLRERANHVLSSYGFDPNKFLNDDKGTTILNATNGIDDDVLQQALQIAQQLQVEKNNIEKAQKMMGNVQDNIYRSDLKKSWDETGQLPAEITVPNGQGTMQVPVESVTPETQTENKSGTPV